MLNKILLFLFTCSFLFGCGSTSTQETELDTKSETVEVDQTKESEDECPEKPGKLSPSNVEQVNLDQSETTVSGQLIAGEALGYSFEGKENQKLTYSTEDEFCMWIYTPDNDILEGLELPKNGSYTVQISIPKGAKTFELAMQLRNPESSDTANNNLSFDNIQENNDPPRSSDNSPSLSPQEAVNLIQEWQKAKRQLFAPPYNRSLGEKFLTGKSYQSKIRRPDGSPSSVDWLENNDAYYTYRLQKIEEITNFDLSDNFAVIDVVIAEQRTLCINGEPTKDDNTTSDTRLVRYDLRYTQGTWKIADQKTEKLIRQGYNPNTSCEIFR